MNILGSYRLILGSGSPRRSQILREADFPFERRIIPVREIYPDDLSVREIPEYLAGIKADAFKDLDDQEILLTADSIVIRGNEVLEKPHSVSEAKYMLQKLSNSRHTVITGVCLRNVRMTKSFSDVSTVQFGQLTETEIDYYIEKYKPFDKAGAYGIQEWIGHNKVVRVEGSYLNIMGLPMHLVYQNIKTMVRQLGELR